MKSQEEASEAAVKPSSAPSMHIDVEEVLRGRVPGLAKILPRKAFDWLRRLVCEEQLNDLLDKTHGLTGAEFCRAVLKELEISVTQLGWEALPPKEKRRMIFVSNHPLGGLDGMALVALIQGIYGGQVWVVVNNLLSAVKPLEDVFLPINKHGKQCRADVRRIEEAFEGNDPIIMFPAGMVSRKKKITYKGRRLRVVTDLPWHKMFVMKAVQYHRDIVPLHFSGRNSKDFYNKANLRVRLGLKFNYEMILLPREVFLNRGKTFEVIFGMPVPYSNLANLHEAQGFAHSMGDYVAMLPTLVAKKK